MRLNLIITNFLLNNQDVYFIIVGYVLDNETIKFNKV